MYLADSLRYHDTFGMGQTAMCTLQNPVGFFEVPGTLGMGWTALTCTVTRFMYTLQNSVGSFEVPYSTFGMGWTAWTCVHACVPYYIPSIG